MKETAASALIAAKGKPAVAAARQVLKTVKEKSAKTILKVKAIALHLG